MIRHFAVAATLCTFSFGARAQFWDYSDPVRLSGTVNTGAEESIPVFSKDSSILYFVRTLDPSNKGGEMDQDIWYSVRDAAGQYTNCQQLKVVNNKFNNAVVGLSADGTRMYLLNAYDGKKDMVKGIAVSEGGTTSWATPVKLDIPGLTISGDFYGFHVSEKEDVMIISYNGPGSVGEEDLYVSVKEGGTWSSPRHMGNVINSAGYEIAPFLTPGQDTLFFSSNGFGGEGDADIFYSVRKDGWSDWSTPKNLGARINSPKFDAFFSYTGKVAYWSSNREEERSDIYTIDIYTPPPIEPSCSATDVSKYKGSDGSIDLTVAGGAPPFRFAWSDGSSMEDLRGVSKGEYSVTITDAVGQTATVSCVVDEPPMPLDPVEVTDYENLSFRHTFGYNKNKVGVSKGDLRKFIRAVEDQLDEGRRQVTIKIVSSASNVPTKSFESNEKLAQTRAENMRYDLVDHFNKKYRGRVNVVIVSSVVAGPPYDDDAANKEKYEPFQFVSLATE